MTNISYNDLSYIDRIDFSDKSFSLQVADLCLTPLRIALNGGHFESELDTLIFLTDAKTNSVALRLFAGIGALFLFPLTMAALAVKWWNRNEWQKIAEKALEKEEIPEEDGEEDVVFIDDPKPVVDIAQEKFNANLKRELACAHHLDMKLGPPEKGSWRKYGEGAGEFNQTIDLYFRDDKTEWPDTRPLVVQRFGSFGECDLKIISITVDFLKVFHQIPIHIAEDVMDIGELGEMTLLELSKKNPQDPEDKRIHEIYLEHYKRRIQEHLPRKNGQYNSGFTLDLMVWHLLPKFRASIDKNCRVIAITSEDLYSDSMANFVFGSGGGDVGIWSTARFGDPKEGPKEFERVLLRVMKISAHEFGHMRSIRHCTDYDCNIGGYMSLKELDSRPLTYCLQDTAKICSLAQTTLLEYNKKLLNFFLDFNTKYGLTCDLSGEIKTLQTRIAVLEEST